MKKQFIEVFKKSFEDQSFIKFTLSKKVDSQSTLNNLYGRLIFLREKNYISLVFRHTTKDITKNLNLEETIKLLEDYLGNTFLIANLFTTEQDWLLKYNKKRKASLIQKRASLEAPTSFTHDRQKQYLIEANRPFLKALAVSSAKGKVLQHQYDKYKQINKYVEIMSQLIQRLPQSQALNVVDMGSGKGYLTFALFDYFKHKTKYSVSITGIELRQHLVDFCNEQAKKLAWQQKLKFIAQDIAQYPNTKIDVLIALHACDIATDIAIAKGIKAKASLIVVAPCCHKQIRNQINCASPMQAILKHGIMEERQAEMLTDGIRSLILEAHGYKTKVFEFISSEHTAKNILITAERIHQDKVNTIYLEQVEQLKREFGIQEHYLETLLMEE
ncbi:MAG: methyltransferase [Saprospiraceae bacterium]|nr:methyltransferase [Saprospiraceae bacterium]